MASLKPMMIRSAGKMLLMTLSLMPHSAMPPSTQSEVSPTLSSGKSTPGHQRKANSSMIKLTTRVAGVSSR